MSDEIEYPCYCEDPQCLYNGRKLKKFDLPVWHQWYDALLPIQGDDEKESKL